MWIAFLSLLACTLPGDPVVEAHRGAAGYYPQNSRTAMNACIDQSFDAIELDLVLTLDLVPVLAHDPWVHTELCTWADGAPISERLRFDAFTLTELQSLFVCGGVPDPDFPNAELVSESIMTLDELVDRLYTEGPEVRIHLDLKYEPAWTAPPEVFAEAVLSRWHGADLPQKYYISSRFPEMIQASEDWGRRAGIDVDTSLSWPPFRRENGTLSQALGFELSRVGGLTDAIDAAEAVSADGLAMQWQVASLSQVQAAKHAGLEVQLWTLNDRAALETHRRWPVDALITDYPGDLE